MQSKEPQTQKWKINKDFTCNTTGRSNKERQRQKHRTMTASMYMQTINSSVSIALIGDIQHTSLHRSQVHFYRGGKTQFWSSSIISWIISKVSEEYSLMPEPYSGIKTKLGPHLCFWSNIYTLIWPHSTEMSSLQHPVSSNYQFGFGKCSTYTYQWEQKLFDFLFLSNW